MPTAEWVQYGCFTLLGVILIWMMIQGVPMGYRIHKEVATSIVKDAKEAIQAIVTSFEKREDACREERMTMAELVSVDREKDRISRHDVAEKFQEALSELSNIVNGKK